jgi:hypothetical protein
MPETNQNNAGLSIALKAWHYDQSGDMILMLRPYAKGRVQHTVAAE